MSESGDPVVEDPSRRRPTTLIVVAVLCVIAAGVALGLVIGSADPSPDTSGLRIADSTDELPTLDLPPGCELLTPGQVVALVPGEPTTAGRGPGAVLDSTESACDWSNIEVYPADPRVQAALQVKATAAVDEKSARSTMESSLPCQGSGSTTITVTGADEACLDHKASERRHGAGDVALVSARYRTLVVEVSYERANWPAWRVDDQSAVTAAALIGRVVRGQ